MLRTKFHTPDDMPHFELARAWSLTADASRAKQYVDLKRIENNVG
jgi:hypothetical protein